MGKAAVTKIQAMLIISVAVIASIVGTVGGHITQDTTRTLANTAPVLSDGTVYPGWGAQGTTFTYRVTYIDADGDEPAYVRVYAVHGVYDMTKVAGDYRTGAVYEYNWTATEADVDSYSHYFEASDGQAIARLPTYEGGDYAGPQVLSEQLEDNKIYLFNRDGNKLWSYDLGRDWVGAIAISADGNYIAVKTSDYIYLFPRSSGEPLWRYTVLASGGANTDFSGWVAISDNGDHIAAAYGNSVALFSKESHIPLWTYNVGDNNLYTVDISSDGGYVVTGVYGGKLLLFSKDSNEPLWKYKAPSDIHALAISADGNYIASGSHCPDRKAYLHSRSSSEPLWSYVASQGSPVWAAAISSDGSYAVYGLDSAETYDAVLLFECGSGKPMRSYTTDWWVRSVDISSDGKYIVAGSGDHHVYLLDRDKDGAVWTFEADERVGSVAMSSDGAYIVAGSKDRNVYFFSRSKSTPLWKYRTTSWVSAVAISSNGSYITAGGGAPQYMFEGHHQLYNPERGTVKAPPEASFTYSPTMDLSILVNINFEDTSTDLDGTITSWSWDFGDGVTSSDQNPAHKYGDKGTYTVELEVTDNDGYTDKTTQTITILNLAPTAGFTYSPESPTEGQDVSFTDHSEDPEGKTLSYSWDFDDGSVSTDRNPSHKYENSGTYIVKLTVTDDEGAKDTASETIEVKKKGSTITTGVDVGKTVEPTWWQKHWYLLIAITLVAGFITVVTVSMIRKSGK